MCIKCKNTQKSLILLAKITKNTDRKHKKLYPLHHPLYACSADALFPLFHLCYAWLKRAKHQSPFTAFYT
jgi:hypothetical protein